MDAIHNESPFLGIGPSYFYDMFKQSDVVWVTPHKWYEDEDKMPNTNRKALTSKRLGLPICSLIFSKDFTIIFSIVGFIASYFSSGSQDSNMSGCLLIDLN